MSESTTGTKTAAQPCCAPGCCDTSAKPAKTEAAAKTEPTTAEREEVREEVRRRYGAAVQATMKGARPSCCGSQAATGIGGCDPITRDLYDADSAGAVPEDALRASFGCGNPTALAELKSGETVLDLGSGGGIDVLLSARRVGPEGKAYGLDMTDEMLDVAMKNKEKAGAKNVEFLKGHIEAIPLPATSVDVIISNCVINLSADKDRVLAEAFRVLRPGGRFAVSDVVVRRPLPDEVMRSMEMWSGCVAGAFLESDYVARLRAAGFTEVEIEPTRIYTRDDVEEMANAMPGTVSPETLASLDGAVMSAFIRARKPARPDAI